MMKNLKGSGRKEVLRVKKTSIVYPQVTLLNGTILLTPEMLMCHRGKQMTRPRL